MERARDFRGFLEVFPIILMAGESCCPSHSSVLQSDTVLPPDGVDIKRLGASAGFHASNKH